MIRKTIEQLKAQFEKLNLPWEAHVHLIGVRSAEDKPDLFDDMLYVIDGLKSYCYVATTNPGLYWLANIANPKGAAVVKGDTQYKGLWAIGMHQGKYKALVQVSPVTVFRDNDKDNKAEEQGVLDTGYFGINCHHANANALSVINGKWSAGCQVVADPKNFAELLAICEKSEQKSFTYTLLKEFV